MTTILIVIAAIAVYIAVKLVIYHWGLPQMKVEIQWKNTLIRDLLKLSKTDAVAKNLVTRSDLNNFIVCDLKFINDKKALIDYYRSVSEAVRNLSKRKTISHKPISVKELLKIEGGGE